MRMRRKYKVACFGGTFDVPTHRGHEALIKKAFEVADFCYIGLTSDYYGWTCKIPEKNFQERKKNIVKYLKSKKILQKRYKITELVKFFGPELIDPKLKIEAIIVSEKTMPGARGINIIRQDLGLDKLDIVKVDMVKGKGNVPISSTRIRQGEIDEKGHFLGK